MKKVIMLFIAFFCCFCCFSQRQLTDSIHSVRYNHNGLIDKNRSTYNHSTDKLTDTIFNYSYSITGGYYYANGAIINLYYPNGLLKRATKWASGGHYFNYTDYSKPNEEYEYEYTDFGEISQQTSFTFTNGKNIPCSISKYYYTNDELDSIVRKDYNNYTDAWSLYDKHIYNYSENGYEEIISNWIPELNSFVERFKTEYQVELGRKQKEIYYIKEGEEWKYRFHIEYEYNEDEYSVIDVEKSGNYSKWTYKYKDDDLMAESLYFWNDGYWELNFKSEYTYFRSSMSANSIPNIKDELFVYSYMDKIFIQSKLETKINIYSILGCSYPVHLHIGMNEFALQKGIYIVNGKKLIVQ
ncbi:MAG: hypothetical protein LBR26_03200 [Prevotella sp.]|jgi:hypothetical protein|nr:hypothetical protein [Prevotella sp.]